MLIACFDVPNLHLCILYNLVECSYFEVGDGLHLTHRSLEGVGIFRFYLANESEQAVVGLKVLARAFVFAPFADDLGLGALAHNVRQMGVHSFVQLAVAAVVDAGDLLSQTFASVLQSLIVGVLLLAVFFVTGDLNSFHLVLLNLADFFRFESITTVAYRTHISFCQVRSSTDTTKTVATV